MTLYRSVTPPPHRTMLSGYHRPVLCYMPEELETLSAAVSDDTSTGSQHTTATPADEGSRQLAGAKSVPDGDPTPSPPAPPVPAAPWIAYLVRRQAGGATAESSSAGPETTLPWQRVVSVALPARPPSVSMLGATAQQLQAHERAQQADARDALLSLCRRFGEVQAVTLVGGPHFDDAASRWLVQFRSSFDATRLSRAARRREPRCRVRGSGVVDGDDGYPSVQIDVLGETGVALECVGNGDVVWLPVSDGTSYRDVAATLSVRASLSCVGVCLVDAGVC